jgi:hypothetical protein
MTSTEALGGPDAGQPDTAAPPRRRRLLRTAIFALVPLLLLLVLLEVTLWIAGLGDPDAQHSLLRGFEDGSVYIVPCAEHPGELRTQMHDSEREELHIGPHGPRTRVLLFGGSNTFLMPEEELERLLNQADPEPGYEVINLGRPGYGSGRVLVLLRQALDLLDPDIVLVYCGHNEFVEGSFAAELAQQWSNPWARSLAQFAQNFRTVNVLAGLARDVGGARDAARRPEGVTHREENFHLTYDQTLAFYDTYRLNLQAICAAPREHGVSLLLSSVVGNDLTQPVVAQHAPDVPREKAQEFNRLVAKANAIIPARLVNGMVRLDDQRNVVRLRWNNWGEYIMANDPRAGKGGDRQAPPLRQLLPPFDGGPLWLDPSNWDPQTFDFLEVVSAFHARDLTAEERDAVDRASRLIDQAVAISPQHSVAMFEQGLLHYLQGDAAGALQILRKSATLDCRPNRCNDVTNGIVREIAAANPDVRFFEAEELYRSRTPDRLLGFEIVMDNCHLHSLARMQLMADFAVEIQALAAARR